MNVWLLLIERRITGATEKAVGPFTAIVIESDRITDSLTGFEIVHREERSESWIQHNGRTGRFDRIVVQPEREPGVAPWGDRGKA